MDVKKRLLLFYTNIEAAYYDLINICNNTDMYGLQHLHLDGKNFDKEKFLEEFQMLKGSNFTDLCIVVINSELLPKSHRFLRYIKHNGIGTPLPLDAEHCDFDTTHKTFIISLP